MIENVITAAEVFCPNQNPYWNPLSRSRRRRGPVAGLVEVERDGRDLAGEPAEALAEDAALEPVAEVRSRRSVSDMSSSYASGITAAPRGR